MSSRIVRTITFSYSATLSYVIELGEYYGRVYYHGIDPVDGVTELDGPLIDDSYAEVGFVTPYTQAHLFELCCGPEQQIGDTMWITHPSYPPAKLIRTAVKQFTYSVIEFDKGPFLTRNDLALESDITPACSMSCDVTDPGAIGTLTCTNAASFQFTDGHVGALFRLWHDRPDAEVSVATIGYVDTGSEIWSAPLKIIGPYSVLTDGRWYGTVALQKSIAGGSWVTLKTWSSPPINTPYKNYAYDGREDRDNVSYRVGVILHQPDPDHGPDAEKRTLNIKLSIGSIELSGVVRVDYVIDATQASVTVEVSLVNATPTFRWAEGAWSIKRGFPASVTFLNGRAIYGGNTETPEPDPGVGGVIE
jgi:hypothetical protein